MELVDEGLHERLGDAEGGCEEEVEDRETRIFL